MNNRIKGIIIAFLAIIILSPDATLITLAGDVKGMTLVFWRGISYCFMVILIMFLMYKYDAIDMCLSIGKSGIIIGVLSGIATTSFVLAIQNTSIANTLIIISSAPVMIAIFSWFMIKEKINIVSATAIIMVFIGIYIVMSDDVQNSNIVGDLLALLTAVIMGISFTMTRKYKNINMMPTNIIGGLISAILAFIYLLVIELANLSKNTDVGTNVLTVLYKNILYLPQESMMYTLMTGIILSISFSMLVIAPRYAPATDVGMIMPLETVLGLFVAWIFLNNVPSINAFIGGFIVISTLTLYTFYCAKTQKA